MNNILSNNKGKRQGDCLKSRVLLCVILQMYDCDECFCKGVFLDMFGCVLPLLHLYKFNVLC